MGIEYKEEQEQLKVKIEKIVEWIRKQVNNAGKKGLVFGLSGGIDSAVVAALCQKAFPAHILALRMPCESLDSDINDAREMTDKFHIPYDHIDLTTTYRHLLSILKTENNQYSKMAKANIKPRLRMIVLYYFAQHLNYLVVGTGNKSELSIGYFTKHGDGGVDILPLGNSLKSEVREMAAYLGIPENIINKPPSAGLWNHQTDEKEMGFSYAVLDHFLATGELEDKDLKSKIMKMNQLSSHKRRTPPVPDI